MSIAEPNELTELPGPVRTLAHRRPGHAVMSRLLELLIEQPESRTHVMPADLASWHVGAMGEVAVGAELARLPEGWSVLHALPAGPKADIDHLVIGPGGVLVLNTKHHRDADVRVGTHAVWVNGMQRNGYQRELLHRTEQTRRVLADVLGDHGVVRPLIVVVGARSLRPTGQQTVEAVRADDLVDYLLELPEVVPPAAVRALFEKAAAPETWSAPHASLEEPDPTPRFLGLIVEPASPPASIVEPAPPLAVVVAGGPSVAVSAGRAASRRSGRHVASGRPRSRRSAPAPVARLVALGVTATGLLVGSSMLGAVTRLLEQILLPH